MAIELSDGIHHVTLITRNVQANVDFYVGLLGLRLVKRTAGFEDSRQLHLFYGNHEGAPGSLVTFLVWEDGAPGRVGTGQISEIAFAVPSNSIGQWLVRALDAQIQVSGPTREITESVLRLKDPDGVIVKLVGVNAPIQANGELPVIDKLHSITILTAEPEQTTKFLRRFGYQPSGGAGAIQRMRSASDVVDVRDAQGYVPGIPGTGTVDHVALRATDIAVVRAMEDELATLNSSPTNVHDRKYFTSLYVREPGGTLIELATDGPGFAVDEPLEHLGEKLFIPPSDASLPEDLPVLLPQFAMPGEPRLPKRDLPFVHRFYMPDDATRETFVLLHGTGGNEGDLMPIAHRIAPRAILLGVRGRSYEDGSVRWFRRMSLTTFDQNDIRAEAAAFAAFVEGAIAGYGLRPEHLTFLGYSNGANFAAAVIGLHPGTIRRAILLRPMPVLEPLASTDLSDVEVLMVNGSADPFGDRERLLGTWFQSQCARVMQHDIGVGHELSADDATLAVQWLRATERDVDGRNSD